MPLRTDLLKLAILFAVAGAACLWSVFAGCASPVAKDKAFYTFPKGAVGTSNGGLLFPSPLRAIRKPYSDLATGDFVVREDRIGLGYRYVLHPITAKDGDEWVMKGLANAVPDETRLNAGNYVGWVPVPVSLSIP